MFDSKKILKKANDIDCTFQTFDVIKMVIFFYYLIFLYLNLNKTLFNSKYNLIVLSIMLFIFYYVIFIKDSVLISPELCWDYILIVSKSYF